LLASIKEHLMYLLCQFGSCASLLWYHLLVYAKAVTSSLPFGPYCMLELWIKDTIFLSTGEGMAPCTTRGEIEGEYPLHSSLKCKVSELKMFEVKAAEHDELHTSKACHAGCSFLQLVLCDRPSRYLGYSSSDLLDQVSKCRFVCSPNRFY
jgi:hypothetical protein